MNPQHVDLVFCNPRDRAIPAIRAALRPRVITCAVTPETTAQADQNYVYPNIGNHIERLPTCICNSDLGSDGAGRSIIERYYSCLIFTHLNLVVRGSQALGIG